MSLRKILMLYGTNSLSEQQCRYITLLEGVDSYDFHFLIDVMSVESLAEYAARDPLSKGIFDFLLLHVFSHVAKGHIAVVVFFSQ